MSKLNLNSIDSSDSIYINKDNLIPSDITYSQYLGWDSGFGILCYASSGDRIHFTLPTYEGYTKVKVIHKSGVVRLIRMNDFAIFNNIKISDLSDVQVTPNGLIHIKAVFPNNVIEKGFYIFVSENEKDAPILEITLSN